MEDNKVKRVEKENRKLANSINELTKQINELKTEMSTKHEEATAMSGQNSKKITDIKHENDKLKNNVHQLQAEKKIASSVMELKKQINENRAMETDKTKEQITGTEHYKAAAMLRESNRKIRNLREGRDKLENKISSMEAEIEDKNIK